MSLDPKGRLLGLKERLTYYDDLYYNHDTSEITDVKYDELRREYKDLIAAHPKLAKSLGIEEVVGAPPTSALPKIRHSTKLLSLDNAFTSADMDAFFKSIQQTLGKEAPKEPIAFMGEVKLDGLAIALRYDNGIITQAVTRGDGYVGEDVTAQVKDIPMIPHKLSGLFPQTVEVRAEVYLPRKEFAEINARLEKEGKKRYSNPRNAASGILRRQVDPDWDRQKLSAACYTLASVTGDVIPDTQCECLEVMKSWGLPVNDLSQLLMNAHAVTSYYDHRMKDRQTLPYDIDGVVIKVNDRRLYDTLGETGKFPRWATAWKFPSKEHMTTLVNIITQVGRTGKVTPVAVLKPVEIEGVTVTRSTLHNEDYIREADLRIGDLVGVQRAGDVIPKITRPILEFMTASQRGAPFSFPTECPSCGSKIVRVEGEADYRCVNGSECPAQRLEQLTTFVGRDAMDIVGLSKKTLIELLANRFITTPVSIFSLKTHATDLVKLPGWKDTSVNKLLQAIEASRTVPLNKFIYALQIPTVGRTVSRQLADTFKTATRFVLALSCMDDQTSVTYKQIESLPGVGPTIIRNIRAWISIPDNCAMVNKFLDQVTVTEAANIKESAVSGKKFVLTGSFTKKSRKEWETLLKDNGASVGSSVSAATDYLVVGDKPGSKVGQATKHGVEKITEAALDSML